MARVALTHCYVTTAVFGLAIMSSGCGSDSGPGEMVVPEQSPLEASKASMDAYKAEMLKGKKGSPKKR